MRIDVKQLNFISGNLRLILQEIEGLTGLEFTITSMYRPGDPGVHGQLPLRGVDLRMRDKMIGKQIEALINSRWRYDPSRPEKMCALLHGKDAGLHLHLQVHPATIAKVI